MMASDDEDCRGITDAVTRFLENNINSVEQLEVLLLLRSHPDRAWTLESLNAEIRTSLHSLSSRITSLLKKGLCRPVGQGGAIAYRYAPSSPEDEATIERLDVCYRVHRSTIIRLIFSKPIDKISVFADAFLVRKDPNDG